MADSNAPLLKDLRREAARLGDDLWQMIELRRQLVELEYQSSWQTFRRFLFVALAATALVATGLPILVATAADVLDDHWLNRPAWLAIIGSFLVLDGLIVGIIAWARFRRQFTPFRATLDELREDIAWLRDRGTLPEE